MGEVPHGWYFGTNVIVHFVCSTPCALVCITVGRYVDEKFPTDLVCTEPKILSARTGNFAKSKFRQEEGNFARQDRSFR